MLRELRILAIAVIALSLMIACTTPPEEATQESAPTDEATEEVEVEVEATEEPTEAPPAGVPISDIEPMLIRTSGMHMVGIGDYVAAERYGIAAGSDPAAQPAKALIMPYAIYPNMHLEAIEDFEPPAPLDGTDAMEFEWSLEPPEGSSAELFFDETVAVFKADVEGEYLLTLSMTDEAGNASEPVTWAVHATTYVGSGYLSDSPEPPQCATCHEDQVDTWSATGHATKFARGVNGEEGAYYNAGCIECHTTGFNNHSEANSGGFDDVALAAGWEFPGTLDPGNWDAIVEEYPEVAAMANIQCESCHGPGNLHNGDAEMINRGLSYATCAQCHAEEPYHVRPIQWEVSAHAQKTARAFWYPTGENRTACVGCHTGGGYIDRVNGVPQEERRFDYQVITCAVCHDPHDATNPSQLRVFDSVTLPNGAEITDAGPAATCMSCHNTRTDPVAAVEAEPTETSEGSGKYRIGLPHYSSAAELMTTNIAEAGYTWGLDLPETRHGTIIENTCITCHMAPTPGVDDKGTPDDDSDDEALPGHNTVGDHTFYLTSPVDGTENLSVCQQCHGDLAQSFDFQSKADYDGDGTAETNKEELEGLLEVLLPMFEQRGVVVLESHPYYEVPQSADVNLRGALYNYHLAMETVHRGSEAHNFQYLVALLQLSYRKLSGTDVPNAVIVAPPG